MPHARRVMGAFAGFRPGAFAFLRQLDRNNRAEWMAPRRDEYARVVRDPLAALVAAMDVHLARIAPEIVGDPRRPPFRLHRDIRFAADKSPFRTYAAFWLFHRDARGGKGRVAHSGAGFYFHLAPDACYAGGGIWRPPAATLSSIRDALADDHETFAATVTSRSFRQSFGPVVDDDMLSRAPRGFPADHPALPWLRHRSFFARMPITREDVERPILPELLARRYALLVPMVRWLNSATGLAPSRRR